MSTSLLYHAFGLVGYQYVSQRFEKTKGTHQASPFSSIFLPRR